MLRPAYEILLAAATEATHKDGLPNLGCGMVFPGLVKCVAMPLSCCAVTVEAVCLWRWHWRHRSSPRATLKQQLLDAAMATLQQPAGPAAAERQHLVCNAAAAAGWLGPKASSGLAQAAHKRAAKKMAAAGAATASSHNDALRSALAAAVCSNAGAVGCTIAPTRCTTAVEQLQTAFYFGRAAAASPLPKCHCMAATQAALWLPASALHRQ